MEAYKKVFFFTFLYWSWYSLTLHRLPLNFEIRDTVYPIHKSLDNKIYQTLQGTVPAAEPADGRAASVHLRGAAGQGALGGVDQPGQPI